MEYANICTPPNPCPSELSSEVTEAVENHREQQAHMGSISKDKKNLGSAVATHWPCADAGGWSGQLNLSSLSWVDNCSCPESTVRLTSQQQPPQHKASPWYRGWPCKNDGKWRTARKWTAWKWSFRIWGQGGKSVNRSFLRTWLVLLRSIFKPKSSGPGQGKVT